MADLSWREVQTVLDEEVQALPAKYRDAFVFCFLEDKSRKGVARELGWEEAPCRAGSIGQKNSSKSGWPGGIILSAFLSATALAHSDELKWYFGLRVHGHFLRASVRHSEVV